MEGRKLTASFLLAVFIFTLTGILWADQLTNVPYWWRGRNFSGKITAVGKKVIIIQSAKNNKKKKFQMDKQTKIFLRNSEKLEVGMYVKIIYKETKQVNIARAIREINRKN